MKNYKNLTAIILTLLFLVAVTAIEVPHKRKKITDKIYVLPLVEEMATNPNPLSF